MNLMRVEPVKVKNGVPRPLFCVSTFFKALTKGFCLVVIQEAHKVYSRRIQVWIQFYCQKCIADSVGAYHFPGNSAHVGIKTVS